MGAKKILGRIGNLPVAVSFLRGCCVPELLPEMESRPDCASLHLRRQGPAAAVQE